MPPPPAQAPAAPAVVAVARGGGGGSGGGASRRTNGAEPEEEHDGVFPRVGSSLHDEVATATATTTKIVLQNRSKNVVVEANQTPSKKGMRKRMVGAAAATTMQSHPRNPVNRRVRARVHGVNDDDDNHADVECMFRNADDEAQLCEAEIYAVDKELFGRSLSHRVATVREDQDSNKYTTESCTPGAEMMMMSSPYAAHQFLGAIVGNMMQQQQQQHRQQQQQPHPGQPGMEKEGAADGITAPELLSSHQQQEHHHHHHHVSRTTSSNLIRTISSHDGLDSFNQSVAQAAQLMMSAALLQTAMITTPHPHVHPASYTSNFNTCQQQHTHTHVSSRRDVLGGGTRSAFEVISPRDTPAIQEQTAEEAVMYDDATPLPLASEAGGGDSDSDSKRVRIPRCPVCRVRKSAPCGSRAAPSRCYRRCMRDGWDSRDKCLQVPRRSAAAGRIHRQASTAAAVAQQARAAVQ